LWIIYKDGIGFTKFIAEILQDHLEDYIDVSVGTAGKIDPTFLVEEELDFLIIGDILSETRPSMEIQRWLLKYKEISKKKNLIVKGISGFCVEMKDTSVEPFWAEFFCDNVKTEMIYPPILHLIFNREELALENGTYQKVKDFSNDFIEYFIENKKR
jgi:hypothetical protein